MSSYNFNPFTNKLDVGVGLTPTFTSMTLTGLTANRLVETDSSKTLVSSNWDRIRSNITPLNSPNEGDIWVQI